MNFREYFQFKKKIKLPKIIFLVGSASAGKSTLARIIKKEFPKYEILTDLDGLKKILKKEIIRKNQKRIRPFPSGGFDIEDPKIWDEVLILTARKLILGKFYIFEFARGIDSKYLAAFKISKNEVYKRCFNLIFTARPKIKIKDSLIIHLYCDFLTRWNRNLARKKSNCHFIAEKVMKEVYFKDIFHFTHIGPNFGYLNEKKKILVYSIDNLKELNLQNCEKYFRIKLYEALEFYNSGASALLQYNKGGEVK